MIIVVVFVRLFTPTPPPTPPPAPCPTTIPAPIPVEIFPPPPGGRGLVSLEEMAVRCTRSGYTGLGGDNKMGGGDNILK